MFGQKVPNVDNSSSKEMSPITTTLLLHELKPMTACSNLLRPLNWKNS